MKTTNRAITAKQATTMQNYIIERKEERYALQLEKCKRLVILHFLGIPIKPQYQFMIEKFDELYSHEKLEFVDDGKKIICGLDRRTDILYLLEDNSGVMVMRHNTVYTTIREELITSLEPFEEEFLVRLATVDAMNTVMANHNGLKFDVLAVDEFISRRVYELIMTKIRNLEILPSRLRYPYGNCSYFKIS